MTVLLQIVILYLLFTALVAFAAVIGGCLDPLQKIKVGFRLWCHIHLTILYSFFFWLVYGSLVLFAPGYAEKWEQWEARRYREEWEQWEARRNRKEAERIEAESRSEAHADHK